MTTPTVPTDDGPLGEAVTCLPVVPAGQAVPGAWYLSRHGREVKVLDRSAYGIRLYSHWARSNLNVPPEYELAGPIEGPADADDAGCPVSTLPPPPPPPPGSVGR